MKIIYFQPVLHPACDSQSPVTKLRIANPDQPGEEVSPASIKDAGVIFTPGSRVQETLDSVKFQKIQVLVFLL